MNKGNILGINIPFFLTKEEFVATLTDPWNKRKSCPIIL